MKKTGLSTIGLQAAVLCACLFLLTVFYGHAASVRRVSMNEMLQQCQLVFEGEVLSIDVAENHRHRIHTYVSLRIHDIIKGTYPDPVITLRFLGGSVGGRTLAVSGMTIPKPGERGIYFVESLDTFQVHPLFGWRQGHFLIKPDDAGTNRVRTYDGKPVLEVETNTASPGPDDETGLSTGVARGVVMALEKDTSQGLTPEQFKKILRQRLTNE